jgi:hypothetical protein
MHTRRPSSISAVCSARTATQHVVAGEEDSAGLFAQTSITAGARSTGAHDSVAPRESIRSGCNPLGADDTGRRAMISMSASL